MEYLAVDVLFGLIAFEKISLKFLLSENAYSLVDQQLSLSLCQIKITRDITKPNGRLTSIDYIPLTTNNSNDRRKFFGE